MLDCNAEVQGVYVYGALKIGFVVSVHCFGFTLVCACAYFKTYHLVIGLIIACAVPCGNPVLHTVVGKKNRFLFYCGTLSMFAQNHLVFYEWQEKYGV